MAWKAAPPGPADGYHTSAFGGDVVRQRPNADATHGCKPPELGRPATSLISLLPSAHPVRIMEWKGSKQGVRANVPRNMIGARRSPCGNSLHGIAAPRPTGNGVALGGPPCLLLRADMHDTALLTGSDAEHPSALRHPESTETNPRHDGVAYSYTAYVVPAETRLVIQTRGVFFFSFLLNGNSRDPPNLRPEECTIATLCNVRRAKYPVQVVLSGQRARPPHESEALQSTGSPFRGPHRTGGGKRRVRGRPQVPPRWRSFRSQRQTKENAVAWREGAWWN